MLAAPVGLEAYGLVCLVIFGVSRHTIGILTTCVQWLWPLMSGTHLEESERERPGASVSGLRS
jgi:hypothetical protein